MIEVVALFCIEFSVCFLMSIFIVTAQAFLFVIEHLLVQKLLQKISQDLTR